MLRKVLEELGAGSFGVVNKGRDVRARGVSLATWVDMQLVQPYPSGCFCHVGPPNALPSIFSMDQYNMSFAITLLVLVTYLIPIHRPGRCVHGQQFGFSS